MTINKYFRNLKKTGPPVETGRPLRLLDMRLFNYLCCADTTAYNGKALSNYPLGLLFVLPETHLIVKLTRLRQVNPINLYPDILSLPSFFCL